MAVILSRALSSGDQINVIGVVLAFATGCLALLVGFATWRLQRRCHSATHTRSGCPHTPLPFYRYALSLSTMPRNLWKGQWTKLYIRSDQHSPTQLQALALSRPQAARSIFPPNLRLERCRYYTEIVVEEWRGASWQSRGMSIPVYHCQTGGSMKLCFLGKKQPLPVHHGRLSQDSLYKALINRRKDGHGCH